MTTPSPMTAGEALAFLRRFAVQGAAEFGSGDDDDSIDRACETLSRAVEDAERMDWLETKTVEVRKPMLYGSQAMFFAQVVSDEGEPHKTDLRERVDTARRERA